MLEQAAAFGDQLRAAEPLARGLLRDRGTFDHVLLTGLGGSGAGARLAVALLEDRLTLPVAVQTSRGLPGWVGARTLVVVTSYSGETVEALDWQAAAAAQGATVVAVTSGGRLAASAERSPIGPVLVDGGVQPRGALGLLLAPVLVLLHEAGAAPDPKPLLDAGARAADEVMARTGPATTGAEARAAAERLVGAGIVLYGAGVRAAVAVRLKNQFNENAKAVAFAGCLPEIAHNEVLGWSGCERARAGSAAVFLRDPDEDAQEGALAEAVAEVIGPEATSIQAWSGRGPDESSRAFALLAFGDLVSCHLAELDGVDLLDVERLNVLKARLAAVRR